MNAALYIRVSTEDQIELSPDSQKKLLLDYAKKNDLIVEDEHIFMDEGISGRKAEKRPEFMKMIALAKSKNKPFQKILVWKFSRFARNQEESIVYKNMLRKDGIEVISISEPIIEGPFGSLIERIIEWMDEYYSIRLSSEVHRGMTEKAKRGGVQSSKPFGYDIVNNKYVLLEEEAEAVKIIFDKFLEGYTYREIANMINLRGLRNKRGNMFEGRNIKYILQNPVYCGRVRWNYSTGGRRQIKDESDWIIVKGSHDPIVSENVFDTVQSKIKSKEKTLSNKKPASTEYKHWLGGLLRCSVCGGTLTYSAYGKSTLGPNSKYKGYFCCNKFKKRSCDTKNSITIKRAEKILTDTLKVTLKLIQEKKYDQINIKYSNDNSLELELLNKQLSKIPGKLKKAKDLYIKGIDTLEEFSVTKSEILNEKTQLEEQIKALDKQEIDGQNMQKQILTILELIEQDADKLVINRFLKELISEIVIDSNTKTFDIQYINNPCSTLHNG